MPPLPRRVDFAFATHKVIATLTYVLIASFPLNDQAESTCTRGISPPKKLNAHVCCSMGNAWQVERPCQLQRLITKTHAVIRAAALRRESSKNTRGGSIGHHKWCFSTCRTNSCIRAFLFHLKHKHHLTVVIISTSASATFFSQSLLLGVTSKAFTR